VPSTNEGNKYILLSNNEYVLGKYFTNVKEGLTTCDNDLNCETVEKDDISPSKITEGIYINGAKALSLIRCTENKEEEVLKSVTCKTFDASTYSYYINHKDINSKSNLIYCNNEKCEEQDGYGVSGITIKTYLNGDDKEKRIIECESGIGCKEVNASGYYIDNSIGGMGLLYCISKRNCIKTDGINRVVYISGDDDGNRLIRCNINDCEITGELGEVLSVTSVNFAEMKKKFYLNGNNDGDRIITAVSEDVENEDGTGIRKIYKWGFPEEKLAKNYAIFVNSNGNGNENAIIHCASETICTEITPESNTKRYLDVTDSKEIIYDVDAWSKSDNIVGNYVIDKSTSEILTANNSGSLVLCTNDSSRYSCEIKSDGNHFYVDSNNNLIVNNNNIFSIIESSSLAKGYYYNSDDDIILCNGVTCTTFPTRVAECTNTNVGKITESKELCIGKDGDNEVSKSLTESKTYILKLGSFAGISSGNILIKVSNNKIVQEINENGYYLVKKYERSLVTGSEEGELYLCTSGLCTLQSTVLQANEPKKYYPNSDKTAADTIICERTIEDETATTPKYINKCTFNNKKPTESYCTKSNKLYSCINGCVNAGNSTSTDCYTLTPKDGYYLPYELNGLINCRSGTCNLLTKKNNLKSGYYPSQDNSNPLVVCNYSNDEIRCEYENSIEEGYYIQGDSTLVYCKNNTCKEENVENTLTPVFYINGEKDQAIIQCIGSGVNLKCTFISKPLEGWYNKKNNEGLIKCETSSNGSINCKETLAPNAGFFINRGYSEYYNSWDYLIYCKSNNVCDNTIATTRKSYYVNGENNKLIYCNDNKKCVFENGNGWYKGSGETFNSIIHCINNKCTSYEIDKVKKGYYLNSDIRTMNKPLMEVSGTVSLVNTIAESGWYLNADISDSKKIIECVKGQTAPICEGKALANSCGGSNNGKFIDDNGDKKIKLTETQIILNTFNGGTFSWITEKSGVTVFEVEDNTVKQKFYDGYHYDSDSKKLYFCSSKGSKLCEEETKITPGYYINYTPKKIIKCTGIGKCRILDEREVKYDLSNPNPCIKNNVIEKSSNIKMCLYNKSSTEIEEKDMSSISNEYIYALENRNYNFPRAKGVAQFRYFLADVSKYFIKYSSTINEVSACGEADKESSKVCLKDNKLVYVKDLITTTNLNGSGNIAINSSEIYKPIEYDADTNNGYYIYKYEKRISTTGSEVDNNVLNTVIIPMNENRRSYKLECKIRGICIEREIAKEPVLGYELENGILKSKTRNEDKSTEVSTKIMPGTYMIYNGNDNSYGITCKYDA